MTTINRKSSTYSTTTTATVADATLTTTPSDMAVHADNNVHDAIEELYTISSYTINQYPSIEMDKLLHSLITPANQSLYVIYNSIYQSLLKLRLSHMDMTSPPPPMPTCRQILQDTIYDALLHCTHLLKSNCSFIVNYNNNDEGTWKDIVRDVIIDSSDAVTTTTKNVHEDDNEEGGDNSNNNNDSSPNSSRFCSILYKPGVVFDVLKDEAEENGGGTNHSVLPSLPNGWRKVVISQEGSDHDGDHCCYYSSRQIVQELLTLSKSRKKNEKLQRRRRHFLLIQCLNKHLSLTLGSDLRDKSSSDTSLNLSFCSTTSSSIHNDDVFNDGENDERDTDDTIETGLTENIFDILAHVSLKEIQRKASRRSTRKISEVLQVVEKIIASGTTVNNSGGGKYVQELFDTILQHVEETMDDSKFSLPSSLLVTIEEIRQSKFALTSPRSIIWLYRKFNTLYPRITEADVTSSLSLQTLTRNGSNPSSSSSCSTILNRFDNPNQPLVVDIGCGLGISLLGLASTATSSSSSSSSGINQGYEEEPLSPSLLPINWTNCNYIGGDVHPNAISWAQTICNRWKLSNKLQFLHVTSITLLQYLLTLLTNDGENVDIPITTMTEPTIKLILLQFPTPWKLKENGNLYLPSSQDDDKFMANESMLSLIVQILIIQQKKRQQQQGQTTQACCSSSSLEASYLLVQSNCEDVALYIHDKVIELGEGLIEAIPCLHPIETIDDIRGKETSRTMEWLSSLQQQQAQEAESSRTTNFSDGGVRRAMGMNGI